MDAFSLVLGFYLFGIDPISVKCFECHDGSLMFLLEIYSSLQVLEMNAHFWG